MNCSYRLCDFLYNFAWSIIHKERGDGVDDVGGNKQEMLEFHFAWWHHMSRKPDICMYVGVSLHVKSIYFPVQCILCGHGLCPSEPVWHWHLTLLINIIALKNIKKLWTLWIHIPMRLIQKREFLVTRGLLKFYYEVLLWKNVMHMKQWYY
jgi:hypothetical protein